MKQAPEMLTSWRKYILHFNKQIYTIYLARLIHSNASFGKEEL